MNGILRNVTIPTKTEQNITNLKSNIIKFKLFIACFVTIRHTKYKIHNYIKITVTNQKKDNKFGINFYCPVTSYLKTPG